MVVSKKRIENWVGKRFNKLVVKEVLPNRKVLCLCDCGNYTEVFDNNLGRNNTTSCGCEWYQKVAKGEKHGYAKCGERKPSYSVWVNMLSRCRNPKVPDYGIYGGRDIKVCDKWKSFEGFLEDMGDRPQGKSLDRIDSNGNYEPSNCKWSTPKEQCLNRRERRDSIKKKDCPSCKKTFLPRKTSTRFCSLKCFGVSRRK